MLTKMTLSHCAPVKKPSMGDAYLAEGQEIWDAITKPISPKMIIQHPSRKAAVRDMQSNTPCGFEPEQCLQGSREMKKGGELHSYDFSMVALCVCLCVYVCMHI